METRKIKMEPTRVLQVLGSLGRGGAECRMMDVWRTIDRDRVHFDFLVLQTGRQAQELAARSLGAEVIKIERPHPSGIVHHYHQLRRAIRSGKYDAVHAHTSYYSGIALLAARHEGVPVRIAHARTNGSQRVGFSKSPMVIVGKALVRYCATERLAISEQAGRYLFGTSDFVVLPNAIDVERYQHTSESDAKLLREQLDIPVDAFVIAQVGRFDPMKNHEFSLNLFSSYSRSHGNAYLVMVGEGPHRAEIQRLSSSLGLDGRVRFTGLRDDVPAIMGAFDVLLHPSTFEGLGGVVLEAQAAGIPVVASEAVPLEADMGLGLVRRLSLEEGYKVWEAALDEARAHRTSDFASVRQAFDERGYSLRLEVESLARIYEGSQA